MPSLLLLCLTQRDWLLVKDKWKNQYRTCFFDYLNISAPILAWICLIICENLSSPGEWLHWAWDSNTLEQVAFVSKSGWHILWYLTDTKSSFILLRVTHFKLFFSLAAWNYEPVFRGACREETQGVLHPGTTRWRLVCRRSLGYIPLNKTCRNYQSLFELENASVTSNDFLTS